MIKSFELQHVSAPLTEPSSGWALKSVICN